MIDDAMDPNDAGLLELTERLEAYAEARLSPSLVSTSMMRTSVMNVAHRRAALISADRTREASAMSVDARREVRARASSRRWRGPAAALAAASLTLAIVAGTAYGAKAGGPLYAPRLWIEAANLPIDPVARAQAEGGRLDARIIEAQQASTVGDGQAAEAALAAYSVIVVEAARGTANDRTASAAIEISVTRHVAVLTQLSETVPAAARAAVKQALVSTSTVIQELDGVDTQDNGVDPTGTGTLGGAARPDGTESTRPDGTESSRRGETESTQPDGSVSTQPDGSVSAEPDETVPAGPDGSVSSEPDETVPAGPTALEPAPAADGADEDGPSDKVKTQDKGRHAGDQKARPHDKGRGHGEGKHEPAETPAP